MLKVSHQEGQHCWQSLVSTIVLFVLRLHIQNKRLAIINVGAPACGMNAAMRAFVRMVVTHKFRALAVNQGFQGLLHDEVGDQSSLLSVISFCDLTC